MNEFAGFLTSGELVSEICAVHNKSGEVSKKIKLLQSELSEKKDESKKKELSFLIAEQSELNAKLKEFSLLRTTCIDQRIIKKLKTDHKELFDKLLKNAEQEYLYSGKPERRSRRMGVYR